MPINRLQFVSLIQMRGMRKKLKDIFRLLKPATIKYKKDDPVGLACTAAYFIVLQWLPSLLVLFPSLELKWGRKLSRRKYLWKSTP